MMIKNTKIEKKQKFYDEVLFPQLENNGEGIGEYITSLENKVRSYWMMLELQRDEISRLNQFSSEQNYEQLLERSFRKD